MTTETMTTNIATDSKAESGAPVSRKTYAPPTFRRLGDVETVVRSSGGSGHDGGNSSS